MAELAIVIQDLNERLQDIESSRAHPSSGSPSAAAMTTRSASPLRSSRTRSPTGRRKSAAIARPSRRYASLQWCRAENRLSFQAPAAPLDPRAGREH